MIIRLAPDLVDEIKRAESKGCSARIKFDANANHPSGNVIDVGGKDFRFTWSREMGDLCDIYEERRSGEDGNGLFVESGCAWRKLNVQRVLDESTKNHVKMRSEEAERKLKSRKAIVLDHGNPSMKSQMKALAAAEVNPWKMPFKQKKEPPHKKRKAEPPPGPPKSVHKYGVSSTMPSKGRTSASPLSTPEQPLASASPFGLGSLSKGHVSVEDIIPTHAMSKEKPTSSEKETPNMVTSAAVLDRTACKVNLDAKPTDLRSILISLLMENPKGMSLKALEKAIGETIPNSVRQIEPILKKIATFQTPGKYLLKAGVDLESLKKPLSESGSSPENTQHQKPAFDDNCDQVPDPKHSVTVKTHSTEIDEQAQLNSEPGEVLTVVEKIDIPLQSPDHYAEKKVSDNNSEGLVATSSDSGSESDSESDSSDSESESGSHSRSKSKSPGGSGSGSSSDSESDASSNSKEGSDEDVDIMTSDDDKELKDKAQAPEPRLSTSPIPWRIDGQPVHNAIDEKQDVHDSEFVEIMKNSPSDDQGAEIVAVTHSVSNKEVEKTAEKIIPSSSDRCVPQESQTYTGNLYGEREKTVKDAFNHEQSDSSRRKSEGKLKRRSDGKNFNGNAERTKKVKAGNVTQAQMSEDRNILFSESTGHLSPARPNEGPYRGLTTQITDRASRDRTDYGLHRGFNPPIPGKSISDSQQSGLRPVDLSGRGKAPSAMDRPGKCAENLGSSVKFTERSLQIPIQKDKVNRELQGEDGYNTEKRPPKNSKEVGGIDKHSTPVDSHYRKRGETAGKFKEAGSASNSHMGYPPKDNNRSDMDRSPMMNGRGAILRRELSDLELGELRDPLPEEIPGVNKQFERKGSFKQSENKHATSDYWNFDASKGKPAGRTGMDSVKPSPPNSNIGILSNPEGFSKKRSPEHFAEDSTKPQFRIVQPQPALLPRVDQAEVGSQVSKLADVNSKSRHYEAITSQGIGLEGYEDTHRKVPVSAPHQHDTLRGRVPYSTKESKREKANTLIDSGVRRKDPSLTDSHDGGRKKRESFSDENSFLYSKYEKEEPDLKGPIKDYSQYMEYVEEYREKYDSYFSINKILEAERNEFHKFGRDLETAKGRDMNRYYSILGQLQESYRQCGTRHKRLKKVFVVLHEELKCLKEMIKDYAELSNTKD